MAFILKHMAKRTTKKYGDNPPWYPDYPIPEDLQEDFDVPYTGQDGASLTMDVYRKKEADDEKLPVIIVVHGGGLFVGHPRMERMVCEHLAREGFVVFALGYRLITEVDGSGIIGDICDGFEFVKAEMEGYGGDPDRVYVIGESAGVFLSINAIVMMKSSRLCRLLEKEPAHLDIKAMACVSGMFYITRKDIIGFVYPRELFPKKRKNRRFIKNMNPENEDIMSKLPPLVLTSSKADYLKNYTIRYAKALRKAKHDCRILFYGDNKELDHAFVTLKPDLPESQDAIKKIVQWFEKYQ